MKLWHQTTIHKGQNYVTRITTEQGKTSYSLTIIILFLLSGQSFICPTFPDLL